MRVSTVSELMNSDSKAAIYSRSRLVIPGRTADWSSGVELGKHKTFGGQVVDVWGGGGWMARV